MPPATTITVQVPSGLRACCGGADHVSVAAATVRDALDELRDAYPELHRGVCDESGAVRRHIGLFVNNDHVPHDALETPIAPGDVFSIMPAVSGG